VCWSQDVAELSIHVDDLNASFQGLPEYAGTQSATICFRGIVSCDWQVGPVGRAMMIMDIDVKSETASIGVRITTWATVATIDIRRFAIAVAATVAGFVLVWAWHAR